MGKLLVCVAALSLTAAADDSKLASDLQGKNGEAGVDGEGEFRVLLQPPSGDRRSVEALSLVVFGEE